LYREYSRLHDYFGRGANEVMHRLKAIRRQAHQARESQETRHQETRETEEVMA
jgi:L-ribulokinase